MSKLNKYIQEGPEVVAESGEYVKDMDGRIARVSDDVPSHDEDILVTKTGTTKVKKGKGGIKLGNLESVVSATQENRSTKSSTYGDGDEMIKVKPAQAMDIAKQLDFKIKVKRSTSPAKLIDALLEARAKKVDQYAKVEYKDNRYAQASMSANASVLKTLPTIEDIYDTVLQFQEDAKNQDAEQK